MTTRVTSKTVIFSCPFVLNEADGEQPPGIYTIETEQKPLDIVSLLAFGRISTVMNRYEAHATGGSIRSVAIDPIELDAALARDAENSTHRRA